MKNDECDHIVKMNFYSRAWGLDGAVWFTKKGGENIDFEMEEGEVLFKHCPECGVKLDA